MSTTILFSTNAKGEAGVVAEFNNAHRGAMRVWIALGKRYLGFEDFQAFLNAPRVWELANTNRLAPFEKIALTMTFDKVMVAQKDLPTVVKAFREFATTYPNSSLGEQADAIEKLIGDENCYAIFWNQISVTDQWEVYEGDEVRLYDFTRDTGHWFPFDTSNFLAS